MQQNFVLLYNTLGYEKNGTKKVLVRSIDPADPASVSSAQWTLIKQDGQTVAQGNFVYRGYSFGLQLWCADISGITTPGKYVFKAEFTDVSGDPIYQESSNEFLICESLYTKNLLLPITLYNALARRAPKDKSYGYFDCNSNMGEARSHGIFLNGLIKTWIYRKAVLSEEECAGLIESAQIAFDYMLLLYNDETGAFSNPVRLNTLNNGVFNTYEALYGFSAFLYYFKDLDPARASVKNYDRAVRSAAYVLERYSPEAEKRWGGYEHFEMLAPVYYYLYKFSGDKQWLEKGIALIDKSLEKFNLRAMNRCCRNPIPQFEGVYLFARELSGTAVSKRWIKRLTEIKDLYYIDVPRRNAWGIIPVCADAKRAAEEWDHMDKPSFSSRQYVTHCAANAMDACFLGELTGDTSLEAIAAGELGHMLGLNAGLDISLVENAPEGLQMSAAAFIHNYPGRRAKTWYYWEWEPKDPRWMSITNGFIQVNGKYLYDYTHITDWDTSETFIKHDGAFAYAFCVYEDFVKSFSARTE